MIATGEQVATGARKGQSSPEQTQLLVVGPSPFRPEIADSGPL